jgi:metal-responsive CopG/Arc/MetJ family transcriptional regulator
MVRINITLPDNIAQELKRVKNKSRFIAEIVREKFEEEKKRVLEAQLIDGYKNSSKEDEKMNQEWENASLRKGW